MYLLSIPSTCMLLALLTLGIHGGSVLGRLEDRQSTTTTSTSTSTSTATVYDRYMYEGSTQRTTSNTKSNNIKNRIMKQRIINDDTLTGKGSHQKYLHLEQEQEKNLNQEEQEKEEEYFHPEQEQEQDAAAASTAQWKSTGNDFDFDEHEKILDLFINAQLGCGGDMSSRVCADDCHCDCTGQNMHCRGAGEWDDGEDLWTTTSCDSKKRLGCEASCFCVNP